MAKTLLKIPTESKKPKSSKIDELGSDMMSAVNKKFKDIQNAFQMLSEANLVTEWVSSGSDILDIAISNIPNGGYGYGTFVELNGLQGSGKSLLAAHVLAETQKQGGLAVLYDTEKAVSKLDFYESFGLDAAKAWYTDKVRALEDVFESMETIIEKYINSGTDRRMTIVVDSVMGASTKAEMEGKYSVAGYDTDKAKILSKAARKLPTLVNGRNILIIFINQLKENMNAVGFGADPYKTTGGTAVAFLCHVRIRTKVIKKLAVKDGEEYGTRIEAKVVKNRLGPKGRSVQLDVYYDHGIDNYGSWLQTMKDKGIVKQAGAYYSYNVNGEEVRFMSKEFRKLLENGTLPKQELYDKICEATIMKYKVNDDFGIDDVYEIENED